MRLTATGKIMLKTMQELAKPLVLYFKDVENFDNQVREDFKFIENSLQLDKKTIQINTFEDGHNLFFIFSYGRVSSH